MNRAHFAEAGASQDKVPDPKCSILNEHARHWTATPIQQSLEDGAACRALTIGLQLEKLAL